MDADGNLQCPEHTQECDCPCGSDVAAEKAKLERIQQMMEGLMEPASQTGGSSGENGASNSGPCHEVVGGQNFCHPLSTGGICAAGQVRCQRSPEISPEEHVPRLSDFPSTLRAMILYVSGVVEDMVCAADRAEAGRWRASHTAALDADPPITDYLRGDFLRWLRGAFEWTERVAAQVHQLVSGPRSY